MHVPVLADEVRALVQPERGGVFVDCTVGAGGHARALLAGGATRLVGLDRDPEALAVAREALAPWADRVTLVHADYRQIAAVLDAQGVADVAGIVVDLGVSSMQLEAEGRGFSFRRDEPLDMRMDRTRGETAAARLGHVGERELAAVIARFGEERRARRVARAIVAARRRAPIETTGRLAEIVRRAVGRTPLGRARGPHARRGGRATIDPATRTFQAIRIWVNGELEGLDAFIRTAVGRLARDGRIAIIAFHSLEDRVVKHTLRELSRGPAPAVSLLTRRPIVPGPAELAANPRARSAKLRAAIRTGMAREAHGRAAQGRETPGPRAVGRGAGGR